MGVITIFNLGPLAIAADGPMTNVNIKGPAILRGVWREAQRDTVAAGTVLAQAKIGQQEIVQPCSWLADIWDPTSTGGKFFMDYPLGIDDIFSLNLIAAGGATISALVALESPDNETRAMARVEVQQDQVMNRVLAAGLTGGVSELPAMIAHARKLWKR